MPSCLKFECFTMIYFILRTRKLNRGMLASHERRMVVLLLQAAHCWTCGLAEGLQEERVSTGAAPTPPHPKPSRSSGCSLALALKSGSVTSLCVCPRLSLWRSILTNLQVLTNLQSTYTFSFIHSETFPSFSLKAGARCWRYRE